MKRMFTLVALMSLLGAAGGLFASGSQESSDGLVVGALYVGSVDDYGYNQAHAQGAESLKAIEGLTLLEEENVAETVDVQQAMKSMIELDHASILFPTSFGYYNPHILEVAPQYPEVQFVHCGGLYQEGDPDNVYSFFGYIDEGQYLNGIAAGYATKTDKLGFVAAKPIPQVLRNINAFTMGAQSVNPDISVTVIFTGDWMMPVEEANATNALADQGVDVVTMHVDSPKVIIQTASKRDMYVCGYHVNQSELASESYLLGAEWNWSAIYNYYVETIAAGETPSHFYRGGLKDGFVTISEPGPALSAEEAAHIKEVESEMTAGDFSIFAGPVYDNADTLVIEDGIAMSQFDPALESMDYLVKGVNGSTGF